ncbi:DEDD exonuclease domain-containing protein [Mycobacterium sp. M1]|uniref:DEDD exonuclease domain-containing protein n=1 Tax=Mycolicibacter acidiphilus TaxID=2835306 RepID=A0ABS5RH59_9MYCO|nr:DEDD exonuclease domain-containing protein [Mycolicibacter acidiphilus]
MTPGAQTGQLSFTDLETRHGDARDGPALHETTFVVVDLETTGARCAPTGDADADAITEIGAVKVRGGVVEGEFATLVNPRRQIPAQITRLTGITAEMVHDAPTIDVALPMFLEFAGLDRGTVLVAHNAGFDVGFLTAAAGRCGVPWPRPPVLCTVRLARRVLSRDEAPSVRLAELARLFAITTRPTHRALDDARATVDVLHALLDRLGNQQVRSYPDLRAYLAHATPAQRRKRVLAEGLPHRPGVYLFRGPSDEVLYVGTSTDLRRRVGQYFNGSDRRQRISEMVELSTRVDHVECAHPLEAGVRELRLLAAHAPPYNRRSKNPRRWWWVTLSEEAFPRLTVTRSPHRQRAVGPFGARTDAAEVAELLARCSGLRTCTTRLGRSGRHRCPPREVAGCPAAQDLTAVQYADAAGRAAALIDGADSTALDAAVQQVTALADRGRYESAARLRDRTATAIEALWRSQRARALAALPELVVAAPDGQGGWQLAVIRYGRLAAAGCAAPGVPPLPVVDAITLAAESVLPEQAPLGGALVEETALIARWLAAPGVRIVRVTGPDTDDATGWVTPLGAAGAWARWAATARSARLASELGAEPYPAGEQLFGRAAVDRGGRALQPVLPRRQPLGAAG